MNIVKLSGNQGSGKTQALNAIVSAFGRGRVVLVNGMNGTNAQHLARSLRGYRDVILCVDECPAELLEELKNHPELNTGRVSRIYAVVPEPVINERLLDALKLVQDCLVKCLTGGEVSAKLAGKAIEQATEAITAAGGDV